jgi:Flp pilus assembly protein TadG
MLPRMHHNRELGDSSSDQQATVVPPCERRRRKSRGQSLAEFAILLPVLILILAAAADFGRAFTAYIAISSAAREGASYAMASTAQANDADAVRAAALADAPTIWGSAPVVSDPAITKDAQNYDMVSVTVTYTFSSIIPIPGIPNPIPLQRTVSMRIIN